MFIKVYRFLHKIRKWYWRTFNIKTFGVRVILARDNQVLLSKHWYNSYWVFPGGGRKTEEDIYTTGAREVKEEVGIVIKSFAGHLGTYKNNREGKDDTIDILISKDFEIKKPGLLSKIEIREYRWFDINNLPKGISDATEKRINEYLSGKLGFEGEWSQY